MRAEIFYQDNNNTQAIPLILISSPQWENHETPVEEQNFFSLSQFKGKLGDICLITNAKGAVEKAYIGSGDDNAMLALAHAATKLPQGCYLPPEKTPAPALLNWGMAQYRFDAYKKEPVLPRVLSLPKKTMESLLIDLSAVFLVRDLINMPANAMGPAELGDVVLKMAEEWGASFEQWVGEELLDANFPAIYTVGRAATHNLPRLLRLCYGNKSHPHIILVGKGVCFDSGGLNIKPGDSMRLMKKDMGGAANALGLAQWIMANQLPIHLEVLIPAVDNLVGPLAFKPGDIIRMRNGLHVEVDNTDAEGRLVLADALALACESKPSLIIDMATLTGAARVAVGTEIAAMFCNEDKLSEDLMLSSKEMYDPIWRLPLFASYESMFSSKIADMSNCASSPLGGAITAALFLQRYITKDIPWAHFDIMAWNASSTAGKPEGGEAMAIRALGHYLRKKYARDYS